MKEILEALATAQNWVFDYGRSDFHNLHEAAEQKEVSHLFLDPVEVEKNRGDHGEVEDVNFSGSFMLLYSSDIDEKSYNDRYNDYIKPIINTQIGIIENELTCNHEATLETWKVIEVINVFDYNLDGIIVNYKVRMGDDIEILAPIENYGLLFNGTSDYMEFLNTFNTGTSDWSMEFDYVQIVIPGNNVPFFASSTSPDQKVRYNGGGNRAQTRYEGGNVNGATGSMNVGTYNNGTFKVERIAGSLHYTFEGVTNSAVDGIGENITVSYFGTNNLMASFFRGTISEIRLNGFPLNDLNDWAGATIFGATRVVI